MNSLTKYIKKIYILTPFKIKWKTMVFFVRKTINKFNTILKCSKLKRVKNKIINLDIL